MKMKMSQYTMIERAVIWMLAAIFVGGTIIIGVLAFWWFYPYEPMVQSPTPFRVIYPANNQVKQGEFIVYTFNYDRKTDVIPLINRQFVDGIVFNSGQDEPAVLEQGKGVAQIQVYIPKTLPPGKYHLRIIGRYRMNPIRVITIVNETEIFDVLPSFDNDLDAK
jgi:hypothetical protein